MADYKIALKLCQSQAGDENAKVKISINGVTVADDVEVSNTDLENPTLFVYDAIGLPDPGYEATTSVEVTLLNDYFVDTNADRNIKWVACGYISKNDDGNYYMDNPDDADTLLNITDWTNTDSFFWSLGCEYTGDENGTIDLTGGWHHFTISTDYIKVTLPLIAVVDSWPYVVATVYPPVISVD